MGCLAEDDLLELTRGGALAEAPAIEAHLAACSACSALVAALAADDAAEAGGWGALVGRTLGPYRLDAQIGAGAMGAVYRGWDERLRRHVAVKVLAGEGTRRLDAEARAAAAIAHPNVVAVHDVGVADGRTYIVSELIDGASLRSVVAAGPVPIARAVQLGLELARGLAAAHAAGVIHRDLKPENLIVARDGVLKILDFGLAKRTDAGDALDATEPGTVFGTLGYMAPEQARGEAVDARADLFAAGAILYELVTGRRAFDGASHADRLSAVLRDTPPLVEDAELEPIVTRCLAKDPAARFQSAQDLAWVLERVARSRAVPVSREGTGDSALRTSPGPRGGGGSGSGVSRRGLLLSVGAAVTTGAIGAVVGRASRRPAAPPPAPGLRQLTFRQGRIVDARFARDGAGVFFGAAWDDEPLAVYALRLGGGGGVARALAVPSADVLAVSANALAIAIDRRHVDGQSATGRLALAPIDGGLPRLLADDVQDADFIPGGTELAVVRRVGRGFRLEAPLGRVLLADRGWITHPRVSPDGGRVACLVHPHANDDQGDLVVVDRASGAARTVSSGWASIAGLAWSRRGDRLWFTASRGGANSALRVVTIGGAARAVFETLGRLRLHDTLDDERLLISRDAWRLRTRVGGGGLVETDRGLTEFSMVFDLADDGSSLLVGELGDTDEVNGGYLVPAAGGERLRLGPGIPLARSRDGRAVFAIGFDRVASPHRMQPMVYAIDGAERRPVAIDPVVRVPWAAWIDADQLVIGGAAADRPLRLWRLRVDGTRAEPLTAEGDAGVGAVDPAGQRVGFVDRDDRLAVVALDGGARTTVAGSFRDHVVCGWRDDRAILVRTTTHPIEIRAIDIATGAASPHLRIAPPPLGLRGVDAVVLAGDRHAYSYGQELSELFLIDLRGDRTA